MGQATSVSCNLCTLIPLICHHGDGNLVDQMHLDNLQKQDDPCVGHGIGQSQDSTSHDCIAQVEDRHAERGFPFKLKPQKRQEEKTCRLTTHAKATCDFMGL